MICLKYSGVLLFAYITCLSKSQKEIFAWEKENKMLFGKNKK